VVLSKRERYIVAATIIAVSLFVLDRCIVTPFLARRRQIELARQDLLREMQDAINQFVRRKQMAQEWKDMLASGLKSDASEAESQVLHAVRDWSEECGLSLSSVKPERIAREGDLQEIMFQTAGRGSMRSVAQFLWRLETAALPLRVKELQLGSRKDGAGDLSLQLRIATLYLAAEPERSTALNAVQVVGGGTE